MNGIVLYKAAGTNSVRKIAGRIQPFDIGVKGFTVSNFNGQWSIIADENAYFSDFWLRDDLPYDPTTDNTFPPHLFAPRNMYNTSFNAFHRQVTDGSFQKIVLSRRKWVDGEVDILASFHKACELYEDQTVVLFSSAITGTWLVATPELLLQMNGQTGYTMALAGTMKPGEGEWSAKNREEQRFVADYIGDTLRPQCNYLEEIRPRTVQAGNLLHLRSDFRFTSQVLWSSLAKILHPTPAVCGLPSKEAYEFINWHEHYDRQYYSGFCGPTTKDTCDLHVILRCAQITTKGYWLYAGGGILPESTAESEWNETERKMETIQRCIVKKQNSPS